MSIGPRAVLLDEYQNTRLVGFPSRLPAAAGSPGKKTLETREVLREAAYSHSAGEGVGVGWGWRAWLPRTASGRLGRIPKLHIQE